MSVIDPPPAVLALSRQPLPTLDRPGTLQRRRRAWRVWSWVYAAFLKSRAILSRHAAMLVSRWQAHDKLLSEAFSRRAVSSHLDVFEQADAEYRDSVLHRSVNSARRDRTMLGLSVERYVGPDVLVIHRHALWVGPPHRSRICQRKFGFEQSAW